MDVATIIGIFTGLLCIVSAIFMGPAPVAFLNIPSVLIVIGGTVAATFVRFPMGIVFSTMSVVRNAFIAKLSPIPKLNEEIVGLAEK